MEYVKPHMVVNSVYLLAAFWRRKKFAGNTLLRCYYNPAFHLDGDSSRGILNGSCKGSCLRVHLNAAEKFGEYIPIAYST